MARWSSIILVTLHSVLCLSTAKTITSSVTVPLNAPVGYLVKELKDFNSNSVLESLTKDAQNFFHVKSGAIVTSAHLNKIADRVIPLNVKHAFSGSDEIINVRIDSSSHFVFPQLEYIGTISENRPPGSVVKVVGHLTASSDQLQDVKYSILSDNAQVFKLENVSYGAVHDLKIETLVSLDRESKSLYQLVIKATMKDGQSTSAIVKIHVLDVNDNIPVFTHSIVKVTTSSDQFLDTIITLQATDADANEAIQYQLEGSKDFVIDSDSGDLYADGDYIHPGSYHVFVYAFDSVGHRSLPVSVFIEVEGGPLVYKPESHFHHISKRATITTEKVYEVLENSTIFSSLFSIATVQNVPQGETYGLISSTVDLFQPPDENGDVYLKPGARLDYEDPNQRNIVILFNKTNIFTPEDVTIIKVQLRVQDKNDEKPIFKNKPVPFLATVSTNPGMGETVYTLYAEDPDTNSEIIYNLESGGEGKFRMVTERDSQTGDMVGKIVTTVSGPGQFVEGREYTLVVSAQDINGMTTPQKSDFHLVKVLVGLRPPQLFENPFVAQVDENSGTRYKILDKDLRILIVRAKCFQDTQENRVSFSLYDADGQASSLFSINNNGEIETLQNLDYEQLPNQYTLNISTTELQTGLTSSSQLIVNVKDVNDNSPKFPVSTYTKTVAEDLAVNSTIPLIVSATDKDSGENGRLVYSVSDDHFEMETRFDTASNQMIGQLKLAKRLDYDYLQDHQYKFNVTAVDQGQVPKSGSATVIIYVTNANDEKPVFGTGVESLYASVSEEQPSGSVVTLIQATDPDGDNVKYYFTPKNTIQTPFRIVPNSGLITLTQRVPETVPYYTLNITAIDDGSCCGGYPILSSQTYIVVEIKDTNNNQPTFPACDYEPVVLENQDPGTSVVQVLAEDNDRGSNGNITYSIVTSPRQARLFEVDPNSGLVVTAARFDREGGQGSRGYSVTVKAADQGQPQSLDSHCTFWVQIGDINDNVPIFDSPSYSTSIRESTGSFGRRRVFAVRASDSDQGVNAEIEYSLVENPGDFFSVEADTGIIYLENPLYDQDAVELRVLAKDRGTPPMSSYATVTIRITDRTNNAPTWDSPEYEREYVIKETAPIGETIATMRASSNMMGSFDDVSFALIDSLGRSVQVLGPFRIYQDGNMVSIRLKGPLDYNIENRYELRLRVTNQGQTPLSAEIRPVIIVKDMNNEPPQFEGLDPTLSNSYKGSVPENEPPGQTVLTVLAVDSDHDPPNNEVSYSLLEDKNDAYLHFAINAQTGVITTRSRFDREEQSVYFIKVKAVDGTYSDAPGHFPPNTPNSATAQVQIIIADKNDNPPYFTQPYWNISVTEQRPDHTGRILTVTARDQDEADSLAYSITDGNIGAVFGIRQKTGDIFVAQTLDYETPPTDYNLTLMVRDGLFQNTAHVLITVTDVNDNAPEFSNDTYEITNVVEETVPPFPEGKFLVQVSARDKDVSRQSNFRFSLSGDGTAPGDPTFTIEPFTGRIYLRKKLDRDLPDGRAEYQFNVIAEDEPDTPTSLFGYAYVKVMPMDINDNDPHFSEDDLHGTVAEHSPAGQSVMTVVARDFDAGNNGTVFYEIDRYGNPPADPQTGEWLFQIASETGLITTKMNNTLDRETTAQYFLQVIAKDRGIEQRSATATVTINISDINDQIPQFVQKIYRVSMSENQEAGPVVTVSATDNDIDENARLTYTLKRSDGTYFSIETMPPNAGVLTVFRPVDYERVRSFNLTVYVQDNNQDHKDEAYIEIEVEDYNDNPPEFDVKVKTIRRPENIPEGTSLWNCSARDADSGVNADFEYSIDRGTDEGRRFTVNRNGEVKIRRGLDGQTLDREALAGLPQQKYEVHILAIDKGYPKQTGTAVLRIFVDDRNDNVPEFVLPHPPMVMEGEVPPKHVVTFSAKDRDTAQYGAPFYFKLPPCEDNPTCRGENERDFTLVFDPNGDNGNGTGTVTAQRTFWRDKQKYHYLPVIMSDMRGKNSPLAMTGTNTLTIEIGDINNHEHKPGHKDIFVYKYDFKGVDEDIVIGNVYAEDPDDWDVKDKHFYFVGPRNMAKYFSVDFDDGLIRMNKKTPTGIHEFTAKVWDFRVFTRANVSATVRVTVEEITDEAIFNSGSVRLTGITAEEFVQKPSEKIRSSPYDGFKKVLAKNLRVPERNVAIFSVMNGKKNAYTDVRFAAHGSPYYQPSKLNGIVAMEKERFEQMAGLTIAMVNIDMCLRETCESGGCSNILEIGDKPNYVNTNGTAFIGIATSVRAECKCQAKNFEELPKCTPGFCYNGGTCMIDEWGDVRCNCMSGFDGPRCQKTRHSFQGGYALYAPLEQCEDSTTSIEFVTSKASGLIFYNGPVEELSREDPRDFISLELQDGYPILQVDHGSGTVTLELDGRDVHGSVVMQKLNDGRWHHIDIIRRGKEVTMMVDRCEMTNIDTLTGKTDDRRPCKVTKTTPGENFYLNVNTMLQMGGRYATPSYPDSITDVKYVGCIRNLIHNGKLYDLYTGEYSRGQNHQNDCPEEDNVCGVNSIDGLRCGEHGICEMTDMINQQYRCTCKPGYRPSNPSSMKCDKATTVRDLRTNSFMSWSLKPDFFSGIKPRTTEIHVTFRTRDQDGILFHLPSNTEKFITLEIVRGRVQVLYNLGDGAAKGDGDHVLSLAHAPASNGQWHSVHMRRIGKWFQLKMDGGEGRYFNETWGPENGNQMISIKLDQIVAGAYVVFKRNPIPNGQDLNKTCIDDIRLNDAWFPMESPEDDLSPAATLQYESKVNVGCVRDDCKNVRCPEGVPHSMVCFPLWGTHDCRCPPGTFLDGYNCLPVDFCERDSPCFVGATCITKAHPTNFTCVCPKGWTGRLCNLLANTEVADAGFTTGFIVIIIMCIFAILVVALLVFLFMRYKAHRDPEKYILDTNDDDDIRENVVNYDEEGAGEEDQDAYDINRLRKPEDGGSIGKLMYDPLEAERYPRRGAPGDKPDVGNFIHNRLTDADEDHGAPPYDSVREYVYEGGESEAGSLSSLNTSSSVEEQDYDYLNDWGPKFTKLANMYGGEEEEDENEYE